MTQGQQQLTCPGFLPPVPNHNPLSQSSNIPQNPGIITQPEQVSSCFQQLPLQHTGIVQQVCTSFHENTRLKHME